MSHFDFIAKCWNLSSKFCSLQKSLNVFTAFWVALSVDFEVLSRRSCWISSSFLVWKRLAAMTKKIIFLTRLAHKLAAVSRWTTWSRASRTFKLLFPWGVSEFGSPLHAGSKWVLTYGMHVTRSLPIGKGIRVGKYNNSYYSSWPEQKKPLPITKNTIERPKLKNYC